MLPRWVIPFILGALLRRTTAIWLPEETCDQSSGHVILEPEADAFVGVVLSLREPSSGLYGCGEVETSTTSMETYEALRWALKRINQAGGQVGEDTVTESYIPGMKLGQENIKI